MNLIRVSLTALATLLLASPASAVTFPSWNFSTCGAVGATGPTQGDCDIAYGEAGVVTVNGGKQTWTVPQTGTYRIRATGAAGASATEGAYQGGRGARLSGEFNLTAGDTLQIVVGQMGLVGSGNEGVAPTSANSDPEPPADTDAQETNGGGGGGSFVVSSGNSPMLIAGGGGGTREDSTENGCDATAGGYATTGSGSDSDFGMGPRCPVKNIDLGLGGEATDWTNYGSAGAGFTGNGEDDQCGQGGRSWANGMTGGSVLEADGGFGGGGTGEGCNGGGGGGGYSGGDAGHIAGGGGSYVAGANPTALIGSGNGDGDVTIELLVEPGRAQFWFAKVFSDDNPMPVEINLSCNTGLPLEQSIMVEPNPYSTQEDDIVYVNFVVNDFDPEELDCHVYESAPDGYMPSYDGGTGTLTPGLDLYGVGNFEIDYDTGCYFNDVYGGQFGCIVYNITQHVYLTVEKEWVDDNSSFNLPTQAKIKVTCDNTPAVPYEVFHYAPPEIQEYWCYYLMDELDNELSLLDNAMAGGGIDGLEEYYWHGDGPYTTRGRVDPDYPAMYVMCPMPEGTMCSVSEREGADYLADTSDCEDIEMIPGSGDAGCTIVNTRLYEGIPALSQYGLAILALLMLGMGFIGFRRYA